MSTSSERRGPIARVWASPWFRGLLSVAVVGLIFGFLFPTVADYGDVWRTIVAMSPLELGTIVAIALWNVVSYWPMLTAVQPGLRIREAAVANLASTAVANTFPGGSAIGIGVTMTMQRSWGLPVRQTGIAALVSGVWNNLIKLGLPIVALGLVALQGTAGAASTVAAVVGLAVLVGVIGAFALLLRSDRLARRVGSGASVAVSSLRRVLRRPPVVGWDDRTSALRSEIIELVEHRWVRITLTSLMSHLSLFAVLLLALRHVGVSQAEISWQEVLAAFAFVRLLSAIPITPGGLGFVELGLTAALGSGLSEAAGVQVAAAVLVYRALTWLVPIPLGVGCWIFWRLNRSWRHTIDERSQVGLPDLVVRPGTTLVPSGA